MACTTILVGKKASYDGSTMIARNDDSGSGSFTPKKFVVIHPSEQPTHYKSEISHVEIDLPDHPMRYTAMPNAVKGEGIWAASGVNAARVGMTATETITSNPRVLGADPLVMYQPAEDGKKKMCWRHWRGGYRIYCSSVYSQCTGRCAAPGQSAGAIWNI
ncbi:MAG: C69 family dipeptidase [Lachnospiraceae bacterium]